MTSLGTQMRARTGKQTHQRQPDATADLRQLVSAGTHPHRL
jgi:hypothetical protein